MKNIYQAFIQAQKAFAPALKTATNPAYKTKYADLSACIEAVIDALNANGIALVQQVHQVESGVAVETVFIHESGERLSGGILRVPSVKHDPQGYGSALTYARRYTLMAACGIAPEDDDGNLASNAKPGDKIQKRASRNLKELEALVLSANSPEILGALWSAMNPDEQTLVRDLVAKTGKQLKEVKGV